jgi:hypothetical protein
MKRRGFLGTLAAAMAIPAVVKAQPKGEIVHLIPKQDISVGEFVGKTPSGELTLTDDLLIIKSSSPICRIGDIIATDIVGNLRIVATIKSAWCDMPMVYTYHCKFLQKPKSICGRPVVKIGDKYVQLKKSERKWDIIFMPIYSTWQEGGVNA